jgi:hypothetical protein
MAAYAAGSADFEFSLEHYFDNPESFAAFHGAWIRDFLARTLARYRPAESLVLKEPHLTLYFPALAELLPEAKFVVMVRDPRDAIASMRDVGQRLAAAGSGHTLAQANLQRLVRQFRSFYRPCLRHEHDCLEGRLRFVRYEDVVSRPADVIAELAAFTGLNLDQADPAEPWKRLLRPMNAPHERQKPWRTPLHGGPLVADSVGRYRKVLSPKEVQAINRALGKFCERFGYATQ